MHTAPPTISLPHRGPLPGRAGPHELSMSKDPHQSLQRTDAPEQTHAAAYPFPLYPPPSHGVGDLWGLKHSLPEPFSFSKKRQWRTVREVDGIAINSPPCCGLRDLWGPYLPPHPHAPCDGVQSGPLT